MTRWILRIHSYRASSGNPLSVVEKGQLLTSVFAVVNALPKMGWNLTKLSSLLFVKLFPSFFLVFEGQHYCGRCSLQTFFRQQLGQLWRMQSSVFNSKKKKMLLTSNMFQKYWFQLDLMSPLKAVDRVAARHRCKLPINECTSSVSMNENVTHVKVDNVTL